MPTVSYFRLLSEIKQHVCTVTRGSHGGDCDGYCLLGCYGVHFGANVSAEPVTTFSRVVDFIVQVGKDEADFGSGIINRLEPVSLFI